MSLETIPKEPTCVSSTEPRGVDLDAPWAFIAVRRWTYAKTVPEALHEYCLRAWRSPGHQAEFDWFVALYAEHGYSGRFWGQEWVYLDRGRPEVLGVPDARPEWRDDQPGSPEGARASAGPRRAARCRGSSAEVGAAGEPLVDVRSRELVERDPLAARAVEGGAGTHGQLDSPVKPQSASAELIQALIKIGYAVQEYGRVARQMPGEDDARSHGRERHFRHACAHRLDRENDVTAQRVAVEPHVGRDVTAGYVEQVERLDLHLRIVPARARPEQVPGRSAIS
jgi:hypothetical protein